MNSFGNLLTHLFAIAFGLGSLKLAVEGLWTGAIRGLSHGGADVTFSAHPLGFVFLAAAWTAFGIGLVWFGWTGFSRPDAADGDEEDAGDSAPARSLPLAGQPSDLRVPARNPLPHVPAVPPAALAARPPAKLPEPLVLYTSRMWAVFVLLVATLLVVGAGFACVALSSVFTQKGAALLFAPAVLGYLVVAWKCVRDFFWQGPALVLDQFGLLDYRHGKRSIPWTDVDAVRLDADSTSSLVLRFRHLEVARQHLGSARMLDTLMSRIFYKGFEGRVTLTSLAFRRAQVLQVAQAFVRHARR